MLLARRLLGCKHPPLERTRDTRLHELLDGFVDSLHQCIVLLIHSQSRQRKLDRFHPGVKHRAQESLKHMRNNLRHHAALMLLSRYEVAPAGPRFTYRAILHSHYHVVQHTTTVELLGNGSPPATQRRGHGCLLHDADSVHQSCLLARRLLNHSQPAIETGRYQSSRQAHQRTIKHTTVVMLLQSGVLPTAEC